eukprot:c2680_g1_i1 orf=111-260(+)
METCRPICSPLTLVLRYLSINANIWSKSQPYIAGVSAFDFLLLKPLIFQ